ncbi:MAG: calcineurin-like phosphoesterase C-terminal domain-containing protein [Verrucomicrobia bacterium]|nr:calcineurin-like phosphoesterase C-terminal domain-containing protein [Verrucomicrobiota bacterium]
MHSPIQNKATAPRRYDHALLTGTGFSRRQFLRGTLAGGLGLALGPHLWVRAAQPTHAQGTVFHDRTGDGRRRPGDPGLAGVAVSNGREVALTDEQGRWRLAVDEDATSFFVIKPRGWRTRLSAHNLPRGYYHHQPAGSPQQLYPGIAPTGPLPESIDFGLTPQAESDRFKAIICGDPQPRNAVEVGYLAQTVVPELRGTDAAFGVSLGDIAFDNLHTLEPLSEAFGLIGIPWHNVLGNHDLNFDAPDNRHANETFRRVFGPTWYAFNHGPVHFIVLNNIEWLGSDPQQPQASGNYRGGLGTRQLEFVAQDLKHVPAEQLVVVFLHIPLHRGFDPIPRGLTRDRQELYRLLENRPRTLSFSAHTHWHGHRFIGAEDGWGGAQPHHHLITGTLCGSWFGGAPDERGIPHATMSDGTPRGYLELRFDGQRYSMAGYKSLGRPWEYQMHIDLPPEIPLAQVAQTAVTVNVFNGSERSTVRWRCGSGHTWQPLQKVEAADPRFVRLRERDQNLQPPYRGLPQPMANCLHLWRGSLPENLPAGTHLLEVVAEDMFGNTHRGSQPIRVIA